MNTFKHISTDTTSNARRGTLITPHGEIQTPVFMPVGTAGSVKGLTPAQLHDTGARMILANTYHMMLRPGPDVVEKLGDLHGLMAWDGPILTDSGGFQVFSLNTLVKVDDQGVKFQSHIDGAHEYLDAERAMKIQQQLGADVIMAFDQCAALPSTTEKLQNAVNRTIKWAQRCKNAHNKPGQQLFGIVQGGLDENLRKSCANELIDMDFHGYAIGGLSVGETHDQMVSAVNFTAQLLPENKPRYLMGVGRPADIIAAVAAGVDMFDCVMPTRHGRNAFAFTHDGPLKLRNSTHIEDNSPVEQGCSCYCCQHFSRGAIRHYFNVNEMLGPILLTIHNIHYYQQLMKKIRQQIEANNFGTWAKAELTRLKTQQTK